MMYKNFKNVVITCFFLIGLLTTNAQEGKNTKFIKLNDSSKKSLQRAPDILRKKLKLSPDENLLKIKTETDKLGFTHEKYQQQFKGIKVEFANYIAHSKNNSIKTMNGSFYDVGKVNTIPNISKETAFTKAISYIDAKQYLWQNPEEAKIMNNYKKPVGELLILPKEITKHKKARLVYKFDIYATKPISRNYIYVDAHSGKVVYKDAIIKHLNSSKKHGSHKKTETPNVNTAFVAGNAATKYSGNQNIETTLSGGNYILRETSRGNGIETYNMELRINYNSAIDFTDNDNNWTASEHANSDEDNAALDAHWGAEKTYDYFYQTYNRNSYDNNGAAIKSYVHFDLIEYGYSNQDNAFWNGSVMTYGDGTSFSPLTSLDIAAHEIGHAVCENTANLTYSYESGAMNEGFSDIWAASVEYYADPTKDTWLLGEEIGGPIRSLSNPNAYGQPDTYKGTNWYSGSGDNGGVHYNSGVLNHWFYILSVGKSGTNDNGDSYNVTGINITKAAAIAYRTESVYLSSGSQYADARTAGIQSAEDLYGVNSPEVIATTNAFYAVGIGAEFVQTCTLEAPSNLSATSITNNSFTLSWNAVSNAASYDVTVGAATTNVTTTSFNATNLLSGTTYNVSVIANCSSGGSGTSTSTNITTTGSTPLSYCNAASTNVNDEYISKVQLGTINNTSGGQFYSDFTSISTNLNKGGVYTLTVTPTWTGTSYSEGYAAWIDYNQDGDFNDAGEQILSQNATKTTPVNTTITIPNSALNGTTRMRISMKYNGTPTSCESFNYGEVEDYTVQIDNGTPTADTTAPIITLNGASTINLTVGDTYNELGATATDNIDGDITANITTSGNVNTAIEGTYTITYNVTDTSNNSSSTTRTVLVSAAITGSTTILHEAFFESGWNGWSDGGTDCFRYTGSRSYEGNYSIRIRDNSGTGSAMTSPTFNLTSYNSVEIEFYFYSYSMENGEDFWLRYYNGSSWTTVAAWASGTNFENNNYYTAKITLNNADVNFATNAAFRFQNDASNNSDYIYIDQVTIKGIVGNGVTENSVNALPSTNTGFTTNNNLFNGNKMIYPNPAIDILNINPNFSLLSSNYSITNVLGQIISSGIIKNNAVNISTLKKGIYLIKLTDEEETFTQKFIKQ
ncbi:M4 family metallopeptidase [Polaribacter staleyi]|uniref:M4 family metallopeptidase n=1 Tax=Polaribacter staleyi TaxID=2022337 RepID=UPI0031BBB3BC